MIIAPFGIRKAFSGLSKRHCFTIEDLRPWSLYRESMCGGCLVFTATTQTTTTHDGKKKTQIDDEGQTGSSYPPLKVRLARWKKIQIFLIFWKRRRSRAFLNFADLVFEENHRLPVRYSSSSSPTVLVLLLKTWNHGRRHKVVLARGVRLYFHCSPAIRYYLQKQRIGRNLTKQKCPTSNRR